MSDSTLRRSVYEVITDRVPTLLDQGAVPWRQRLEADSILNQSARDDAE